MKIHYSEYVLIDVGNGIYHFEPLERYRLSTPKNPKWRNVIFIGPLKEVEQRIKELRNAGHQ